MEASRMAAQVISVLLVTGSAAADQPDPKAEQLKASKQLQGTWNMVARVRNGQEVKQDELPEITWTFKGDTLTSQANDEEPQVCRVRLDPTCSPKLLDLAESEADFKHATKVIEAVYILDGDTLRVCVNFDGDLPARGNRPVAAESKVGSSSVLMTLKRQKK